MLVQVIYQALWGRRERLQERLATPNTQDVAASYRPIVLAQSREELQNAFLNRVLGRFNRTLVRACPETTLRKFIFIVAMLSLGFFTAAAYLSGSLAIGAVSAAMAGMVPFLVVRSRSARRQRIIDDQLPDSLDFLARILRAGHSLATAFQMSGEELPDPLAGEFRRCYDQHSLGQPLEEALKEMAARVDVPDFAFFVTAVLIQRQTGGDLAEVLKNIGSMVRSRMRLQQHVRAITAEGRLVGTILLALPFAFFVILYVLNREYAGVLLTTHEGRYVVLACFTMQVLGFLTIRRIVSVKM
jgi:tight adherence protein B